MATADRKIWGADWLREHANHGGIMDITSLADPIGMIRRRCYCGSEHFGRRTEADNGDR